jgi:hypothetical protein
MDKDDAERAEVCQLSLEEMSAVAGIRARQSASRHASSGNNMP